MRATDPFARRVDDLHPDERFEELASILASGLLRLKASKVPLPESAHSPPQKNRDCSKVTESRHSETTVDRAETDPQSLFNERGGHVARLRCEARGCAMVPTHTTRGTKRYRYYVCSNAQKRGWKTCPTKSIPAPEIERFVFGADMRGRPR